MDLRLVRCIPNPATKPARPHKKREIISGGVNEIPNERRGTPGRRLWTANQTSSTQSTAPFSFPRPSVTLQPLLSNISPCFCPPSLSPCFRLATMYVSSDTLNPSQIFRLLKKNASARSKIFLLLQRNLETYHQLITIDLLSNRCSPPETMSCVHGYLNSKFRICIYLLYT